MDEKLLLEIEKRTEIDETSSKKKISEYYSVLLNKTHKQSLSLKEIDDLYNLPNGQSFLLPTISYFKKLIENKDFYNEIKETLDRDWEIEPVLLTVKSREAKILGLPWEIFLVDEEHQLVRRPNLLLRRCIGEIQGENKIDLSKDKLYLTYFSKLKTPGGLGTDITESICDEIKNTNILFKEIEIKAEITKEEIRSLNGEFSFVHYGGHGVAGYIETKNDRLGATDFRNIKSELLFLNCCQSGYQKRSINSLCYDLIKLKNFKFVIGMQYNVKDEYALDFTKNFYEELKKNNGDVLNSLFQTQIETRLSPTTQSHLLSILYQD